MVQIFITKALFNSKGGFRPRRKRRTPAHAGAYGTIRRNPALCSCLLKGAVAQPGHSQLCAAGPLCLAFPQYFFILHCHMSSFMFGLMARIGFCIYHGHGSSLGPRTRQSGLRPYPSKARAGAAMDYARPEGQKQGGARKDTKGPTHAAWFVRIF